MISRSIDQLKAWGGRLSPGQLQWLWFAALWLAGLLSAGALASAIRWLMNVG